MIVRGGGRRIADPYQRGRKRGSAHEPFAQIAGRNSLAIKYARAVMALRQARGSSAYVRFLTTPVTPATRRRAVGTGRVTTDIQGPVVVVSTMSEVGSVNTAVGFLNIRTLRSEQTSALARDFSFVRNRARAKVTPYTFASASSGMGQARIRQAGEKGKPSRQIKPKLFYARTRR
jgi:hypothetical protein